MANSHKEAWKYMQHAGVFSHPGCQQYTYIYTLKHVVCLGWWGWGGVQTGKCKDAISFPT